MRKIGSKEHKRLNVFMGLRATLDKQFTADAEKLRKLGFTTYEEYMMHMPDEYVYARKLLVRECEALMARLSMMDE